jgi:prophage regulatory protein
MAENAQNGFNRFLRLPAVKDRSGWGRSSIYAAMARGDFPKPIRLGSRAVAWLETDIEKWLQERIAGSHVAQRSRP